MPTRSSLPAEVDLLLRSGRLREVDAVCKQLSEDESPRTRVAALLAIGTARFDSGNVGGAIEALRTAHAIAESDCPDLEFRSAISLFSRESQFQALAESLPTLARLRQSAYSRGTADALGNIHLVVARLEACRGLCVNARRHLELSRRLLWNEAAVTRCAVLLVDSALELYAGNFKRALVAARNGLELAKNEGLQALIAGSLANLGTVMLFRGRPTKAREILTAAVSMCDELRLTRFSVLIPEGT
jgi:tetratricopeptide (TPR) repeat protein